MVYFRRHMIVAKARVGQFQETPSQILVRNSRQRIGAFPIRAGFVLLYDHTLKPWHPREQKTFRNSQDLK